MFQLTLTNMRRLVLLLTILVVMVASRGSADLIVTLDRPVQNVAAGGQLTFSGTLQNSSLSSELFLNSLQIAGAPPALTLLPNVFYSNVPGILLPGESYTGPLFSVSLASGAPSADYEGSVTFL